MTDRPVPKYVRYDRLPYLAQYRLEGGGVPEGRPHCCGFDAHVFCTYARTNAYVYWVGGTPIPADLEGYSDVSHFFGLSYNPYLTVPRSLLESMSSEWQKRFVDLLEEMCDTPAGQEFTKAHYLVRRTCPERDATIQETEDWNAAHEEDVGYTVPEVLFINDPFYNYRHPNKELFPAKGGAY